MTVALVLHKSEGVGVGDTMEAEERVKPGLEGAAVTQILCMFPRRFIILVMLGAEK